MLSLAAGTVLDAAASKVVAAAAAAGFDACGLRLDPTQLSPGQVRAIRTEIDDAGIELLDLEVIRLNEGHPVDRHQAMLELAAELGAAWVLTVVGMPDPAEQAGALAELDELAAPLGVRISLEFMAFTAVRTLADALVLADRVPRCGVLVDALHLNRTGGGCADVAAAAGRLSYLQLCDGSLDPPSGGTPAELAEEARHHRVMPGDGAFDLAGLIRAVPGTLPVSVEVQSDRLAASRTVEERAALAYRSATRVIAQARSG